MNQIEQLRPPRTAGVTIEVVPPRQLKLSGTMATRDPAQDVAPFLRSAHAAALSDHLSEFRVDVTGLAFVNSAAIRLFVDWATWVKNEAEARRYQLTFVMDPEITWQKTTFSALSSLAKGVIQIETAS
jgi:hypothetical protein